MTAASRLRSNRSFLALCVGQAVSLLGDRLNYVALVALLATAPGGLVARGSTLRLGVVAACMTAPVLLFAGIAGHRVDHWRKKRVLVTCDALRAALVLLVPVSQACGLGVPGVLAVVALLYTVNVFFLPARAAIVPEIVQDRDLVAANAATTSSAIAATILGSVLGGLVIQSRGWRWGFYADAASYALSVAAMSLIRAPAARRPHGEDPTTGRRWLPASGLAAGWRAIRGAEGATVAVALFVALYVAGAALFVLAPPGVGALSLRPARDMGFLIAALATGVIAGAAAAARIGRRAAPRALCAAGAAVLASGFAGFAAAPSVPWFAGAALLAGLGAAPLLVSADAVLQAAVPSGMRARAFAVRDVLSKSAFLGAALGVGVLATRVPRDAVLLGGAVGFAAGAVALARAHLPRIGGAPGAAVSRAGTST